MVSLKGTDSRGVTDRSGRFVLTSPEAGRQTLVVETDGLGKPGQRFGTYDIRVHLKRDVTNAWTTRCG